MNNYYNYDDDITPGQELEDERMYSYKTKQKKSSPDVYKKTYYTTNGINNITISKYEMEKDWKNNNQKKYNNGNDNNGRLMTDNGKNYFRINNSKKNILKKEEPKYFNKIPNINRNNSKTKLITKRLSLKSTKNGNKNKDRNFRIEKLKIFQILPMVNL